MYGFNLYNYVKKSTKIRIYIKVQFMGITENKRTKMK